VYSTLIFDLIREEPPNYSVATVLAALTLVVIALVIPLSRWIVRRHIYTTISSGFRMGLVDIGKWKWVVFGMLVILHVLLTFSQVGAFILSSFMSRTGFFEASPTFTLAHWQMVYSNPQFLKALRTTLVLAFAAGLLSPLLFSTLAYIIVRTQWPGRYALDSMIWVTAAIPGMLAGLGLLMVFLSTPVLAWLYGTIGALILVVILQGNTSGVNITKGALVQVGHDMEDAARVSGAGWFRTYFRIWIPLMAPTLILLGTLNFVIAANTTSSVILLTTRETITLSILALEWASGDIGQREAAAIVSLHIGVLTLVTGLLARRLGMNIGIHHG
jgi:iron(III) transport system permease protein